MTVVVTPLHLQEKCQLTDTDTHTYLKRLVNQALLCSSGSAFRMCGQRFGMRMECAKSLLLRQGAEYRGLSTEC